MTCFPNFSSLRNRYGQNVVTKVRKLVNIRTRIAKYRSHLYFNHRCKENKVLPHSLRFKPLVRSKKGFKLMENTGFSFLRLRIDDCHHSIQRLGSEWSYILRELSVLLDNSEIRWVEEFCCSKERNASIKRKMKHDKKLSRLLGSKSSKIVASVEEAIFSSER